MARRGRRERRGLLAAATTTSNDNRAHVRAGRCRRGRAVGHVRGAGAGTGAGSGSSSSSRRRRPLRAALPDACAQAVHAVTGLPVAPVTGRLAVAPDLPPAARLARLGVLLHPGGGSSCTCCSSGLPGAAPSLDLGRYRGESQPHRDGSQVGRFSVSPPAGPLLCPPPA